MAKRIKKQEVHYIDMSSRLHIKIVESTIEEENELQEDLDELQRAIEERMRQYEESVKRLIMEACTEPIIDTTEEKANYFIEKYKEQFKNRNQDNVQNRFKQYQKYIDKMDD